MQLENIPLLDKLVASILSRQLSREAWDWLQQKASAIKEDLTAASLNTAFAAVSRKIGKAPVSLTDDESSQVRLLRKGFSIVGWPADRLSRAWLILQVNTTDAANYQQKIENLFRSAEMNEFVALYAALPVFAYPESWKMRMAEGIRSNIGSVLESIMYANPFPEEQLDESAWNQLVMKAFFTEKNVHRISGLEARANPRLAAMLVDYAHERQAAHRSVPPALWRLVARFIDENNFADIEKLFASDKNAEQRAAALACYHTSYEPARKLLSDKPALIEEIRNGLIHWEDL